MSFFKAFVFVILLKKQMLSNCLEWLKRDEFKREIKDVLNPVMELLMDSLKPYLLYGISFILLNFVLLLSILLFVMRKKNIL
jgi:hypothetical protein